MDVARPGRILTLGKCCFGAHLIYCQAAQRLRHPMTLQAIHAASPSRPDGDDPLHNHRRRYHDQRYSAVSTVVPHEVAAAGERAPVDLIHLAGGDALETYWPPMSPRCIALIQGAEAPEAVFRLGGRAEARPAVTLRIGAGLTIAGFGPSLPERIDDLMRLSVDQRLFVEAIYARLGKADGHPRPARSRPSPQPRVAAADPAFSALREETGLLKQLLWSSHIREDALVNALDAFKEVERDRAGADGALSTAAPPPDDRYIGRMAADAVVDKINATVSVVIPTYNAGVEFDFLLKKLRGQRGVAYLEIVVIDSGSSDDTVATARRFGCKVLEIDNKLFSHSFARNLGADLATGQYLLFMVQDAFPVGDLWIRDILRVLMRPLSDGSYLAAVSCAEHPRLDSELIYNFSINVHYRFLGCYDRDKVGQLTALDHHALRTQGQLSDVTCLISRSLFLRYRHHGRYAEDLLLGIKLIKDGHRVAMLSSIKVIHSHTRPLGYYVRRVFVDVIFLRDVFPDFAVPAIHSVLASYAVAVWCMHMLPVIAPSALRTPADVLGRLIADLAGSSLPTSFSPEILSQDFENPNLASWVRRLSESKAEPHAFTPQQSTDMGVFRQMLIDRLAHLMEYVGNVHLVLDIETRDDLAKAIMKTLGMTLGATLGFHFLTKSKEAGRAGDGALAELRQILLAGI